MISTKIKALLCGVGYLIGMARFRILVVLLTFSTLILCVGWTAFGFASEFPAGTLDLQIQKQRFTSEFVVKDPFTGLAMGGVDPLSYFIDNKPKVGTPEMDAMWGGANWWFVNKGNRAAFLADPDVYSPSFGGYGAMAVARGHLAQGRAGIWLLQGDRLFLFHSHANRVAWQQNSDVIAKKAAENWQRMLKNLVP